MYGRIIHSIYILCTGSRQMLQKIFENQQEILHRVKAIEREIKETRNTNKRKQEEKIKVPNGVKVCIVELYTIF